MIKTQLTSRRIQVVLGAVLLAGLLIQCQRAMVAQEENSPTTVVKEPARHYSPSAAFAAPVPIEPTPGESLDAQAARDPIGFLQMALDRYDRTVRDYTCTFTKQELLGDKLSQEQIMKAYFRQKPLSVRLEWKKNPDKVSRALYVADKWVEDGQQMALVEPAGAIAQLFVSYVFRPIHGEEASQSSRRSIDQFGLRNTLNLSIKFALLSREKNKLDLAYKGTDEFDGRPTLVFERRLPYTGEGGIWPDRLLVLHMDREMLLPTLCSAYADDDKKVLLGRYQITDVKLNANLPDSAFTKEGMGF